MNKNDNSPEFNRRNFLKSTSFATVMAMMGGVELNTISTANAADAGAAPLTKIPVGPTVKYGVIGVGEWGREIVHELALLPNAPVVAVCDKHKPSMRRALEVARNAKSYADYHELLADADVEAVVVATPTGLHREFVEAALKANKHVYCEAPLATTIDDAKAIAKAARDAVKVLFQPGLQERSHPERKFLLPFIRSGALGDNVMVRAQSHQNRTWEMTPWKMSAETSTGLMGEIGIHQIDAVSWFMRQKPRAVTGFGAQIRQNGGGDVADTVQGVFDFPGSVRFVYDATLCNSFDKDYEIYYGTQSAIMVRDGKAWMFYEPDAQLGGWEVYARKDEFYNETGIVLGANATKQSTIGTSATANTSAPFTPLHYALEAFTNNTGQYREAVKSFIDSFGDSDMGALADSLKTLKPYYPAATWQDGLDATILALKATQAVVEQKKITIEKDLFNV